MIGLCEPGQNITQVFDLPMSVNAVPALATAKAAPMAMMTLKPDTKDSSTVDLISWRVAGS
jgi:hypothetical protein